MMSPTGPRNVVAIGVGLLLTVLLVGGVLGVASVRRLADNERWVAHTHEVIEQMEDLLSTLDEAESEQRGYLLTEDDKYLQTHSDSLRKVQDRLNKVKELTSDNRLQQDRLAEMEPKVAARLAELRQTVALVKGGDRPAAMMIVRGNTGKAVMDDLRGRIAVMRQTEEDLLRRRSEASKISSRTTVGAILLPAIIAFVLVCIVFYLSQRNLLVRQRAAEVLAEQRERLRTTLASIGDAVISTDNEGGITNMNVVAESLTGWKLGEAVGQPLDTVFRIVNEETRQPVENPATRAMKEGIIVGLANHTVLIAKGGSELPIDDSAAPVRCAKGEIVGCVLVFRDVTARRQAERGARSLAAIVESSDDAIIGKDINGIITNWNGSAERLFGYSSAEAIGRPIAVLSPPDRADEMPALLARLKQGERIEHFETVRRAKNGRLVPVSLTVSPIRDKDGRVVGASKIARDISERQRAEEALREEKDRLHATLTGIGDAVIVTDAESRVTMMNPVARALTGWSEEAVGKPLAEVFRIINEQTRQPVESPVSKVMREGTVVGLANHTALVAKDGTERPIEDSAAPIRGKDGEVIGVVLVFRDASERREAEAAAQRYQEILRAKEAELDLVISRTPMLLVRCSRDLRYAFANRAYAEFFRRPAEQIVGRPIPEIVGESAFATIAPHVERVLRGESVEFEAEIPYAHAGRRFMRGLYTPERNDRGEVVGWIATLSDITERKQLEREREERAAELAVALGKRTEEAKRAEKAERLLREADRRKDEFLATLAHELRNPLAPLRNALELLRRADGNKPLMDEARGMMERQVSQMVRLVDDLLDISRITQGKLHVRKERVELRDVLNTAVETARPLIEASSHDLTLTLPPQAIHVQADPIRLAQVFSNLLNNAAKYTEKAGHIWLTAERRGNEAVVSVRDTGIGIAAEHVSQLFKMFAQMAPALERSQGGLGIGLSLVKGLVELHGGTIEAHSAGPGKGSEFAVHLPIVDVPVEAPIEPSGDGQDALSVRKCRILVVDDLRDAADSLAEILRMMGHETCTAYDGLEAVQTAAAFQADVVLLDIGLPKMNGYEAARHIREQPWGGNVALIALTGWGQEEDKRRSLEAGFDHHLTKPVEAAALEKLLALIAPRH